MLERHGIPTIGFCGLSEYKGTKKVAPTKPPAAPAPASPPVKPPATPPGKPLGEQS